MLHKIMLLGLGTAVLLSNPGESHGEVLLASCTSDSCTDNSADAGCDTDQRFARMQELIRADVAEFACEARLQTKGCPQWLASADVLFWTARNPHTEYGISDIGGVQDRGAVGQVLAIGSNYDPGIRFTLGRQFGDCCRGGLDVQGRYVNFDSETTVNRAGSIRSTFISSDNSENDDSDNINTLGVETITPDDRATNVSATYEIDYQTFDVEVGQTLILTEGLDFRIRGGGRGLKVEQLFQVTYTGGDFQTAFTPFQESAFHGGGLYFGGEANWHLTKRLRLNIGANGGILIGNMETRTFIPDDEPGVPTDVTFDETRLIPMMELAAAVNYEFNVHRFRVTTSVGYDITNWFGLATSRTFSDSHQEGQNSLLADSLTMDGLYGRVGIAF